MGGRKDIKQKKNKRSRKILGLMEKIYSGKWYMGEGRGFEKCKEVSRWVRRKIRGRSKKTEEDRRKMKSEVESKDKWVQKEWATREIYSKVAVWLEQ